MPLEMSLEVYELGPTVAAGAADTTLPVRRAEAAKRPLVRCIMNVRVEGEALTGGDVPKRTREVSINHRGSTLGREQHGSLYTILREAYGRRVKKVAASGDCLTTGEGTMAREVSRTS